MQRKIPFKKGFGAQKGKIEHVCLKLMMAHEIGIFTCKHTIYCCRFSVPVHLEYFNMPYSSMSSSVLSFTVICLPLTGILNFLD